MLLRNKKGKLAVEYIAIIVLVLAVLVILLIFSNTIREKMTESMSRFIDMIKGR